MERGCTAWGRSGVDEDGLAGHAWHGLLGQPTHACWGSLGGCDEDGCRRRRVRQASDALGMPAWAGGSAYGGGGGGDHGDLRQAAHGARGRQARHTRRDSRQGAPARTPPIAWAWGLLALRPGWPLERAVWWIVLVKMAWVGPRAFWWCGLLIEMDLIGSPAATLGRAECELPRP
jgi:hypothetical protein